MTKIYCLPKTPDANATMRRICGLIPCLGKVKASKNYIFFSISCREKDVQIVERILRQGSYLE